RVHTQSVNFHYSSRSVKVLIFQLSGFATVHCISPFGTKLLNIKFMCTSTDFLIGSKSNCYSTEIDFRMCQQILCRGHNFGNSGLIICSKQGGSVGSNQCFAEILLQVFECCRRKCKSSLFSQKKITTVIIIPNLRLHAFTVKMR